MTFGINGAELIVLIVLAVLVLGPEKLPDYARKLTGLIRSLRQMAEGAKTQFKEETGTDFDEIDWKKYDPRQYDPRRIIRDALAEPVEGSAEGAAAASVSDSAAGDTASEPESSRAGDDLRSDLEAVRGERDALRQDLKDLDPRSVLFGSSSRRTSTGTGAGSSALGAGSAVTTAAAGAASTAASTTAASTGSTGSTETETGTGAPPADEPADAASAHEHVEAPETATDQAPFDVEAT